MPPTENRRRLAARLTVLQVCATVVFALLVGSFWVLQVVQGESYRILAENNNQRTLTLRAPRGVVYDRHMRVLVENRDSFTVSLDQNTKDVEGTIERVAAVVRMDADALREIVERRRHQPRYRAIALIEDATLEQVAAIKARQLELPGVLIEEVPARQYPTDALAAHLFGYVGEASEAQVSDGLPRGSIVGKSGIELVYNQLLMGEDGEKRVVVNSVGRHVDELGEDDPVPGRRVQLTLDYDLQKATEDGFRHAGFDGAALIMDPRNGEVLSYVSLPTYDPNDFVSGIDTVTWASLNTDTRRPLQNRVIQGRYSPGSIFKIAVAVAALEEGVVTPDFKVNCSGGATFFGRRYRCHLASGHGLLDMRHALEKSCNVYFYTLGNMLGVDRIYKWAEKLGLAGKTGIDLPNEQESLVPSTEWKKRRYNEPWYPGETISVSIGQGQVSVTPASLALMISTVANGGTRVTPHIIKALDDGDGWKPVARSAVAERVAFKPETLAALHEGLWMVVNANGTGGRARIAGRDVAGKTGTAQVISNEGRARAEGSTRDLRDHGWFVFFAPRDNPEIAGVIFGEHNEHGYLGAPIARHVIETYFAKKEGQPLPSLQRAAPARPAPSAVAAPSVADVPSDADAPSVADVPSAPAAPAAETNTEPDTNPETGPEPAPEAVPEPEPAPLPDGPVVADARPPEPPAAGTQ